MGLKLGFRGAVCPQCRPELLDLKLPIHLNPELHNLGFRV